MKPIEIEKTKEFIDFMELTKDIKDESVRVLVEDVALEMLSDMYEQGCQAGKKVL